jgi:hypothetical protein
MNPTRVLSGLTSNSSTTSETNRNTSLRKLYVPIEPLPSTRNIKSVACFGHVVSALAMCAGMRTVPYRRRTHVRVADAHWTTRRRGHVCTRIRNCRVCRCSRHCCRTCSTSPTHTRSYCSHTDDRAAILLEMTCRQCPTDTYTRMRRACQCNAPIGHNRWLLERRTR